MSTLHHESILEDCLVEAEENFRVHNKLTQKLLDELIVRSEGVRLAIEKQARNYLTIGAYSLMGISANVRPIMPVHKLVHCNPIS